MVQHDVLALLLVFLAGVYAGTQNTLAGGGSFITFPALLLFGLNPLAANITSTVALFPNQITSAWAGRNVAAGFINISLSKLFFISVIGGILGALLLLATPVKYFESLVPWLVLFATVVFIWGSFRKGATDSSAELPEHWYAVSQFLIGVYGGYFGGGIGILMLAALTMAGQQVRAATATKNVLAMAMNASAVALFVFSQQVNWYAAMALSLGGIVGALIGNWLLHRLPVKVLKSIVIAVGLTLTVWLFVK